MRRLGGLLALLVVPLLLGTPAAADAQVRSLTWTETTTFEVPGALGSLMGSIPGSPMRDQESSLALYLEGSTLRQDDGSSSFVIDAERGEILSIDHDARSFMRFTFAEAGQMAVDMEQMVEEAMLDMEENEDLREARRQQEEAMEEMRRAREESTMEMDFRVSTESTGETRSLADGITGTRHFVTAELEVTEQIEGAESREGGILTILVELWQSEDVPMADELYEDWARALQGNPEVRAMADEMAASFEGSGQESGAEVLSVWDPRISAGMIEIAEAVEELEGTTVRSTMTVALVPTTVEFSREELLAWEPESMGSQLAGSAGDAVRDAARGALGGLFGGGDDEEEEEEVGVQPLLRMTSVKENVLYEESAASVMNPLYETIQGYEEIDLAELMRQIQAEPGGD